MGRNEQREWSYLRVSQRFYNHRVIHWSLGDSVFLVSGEPSIRTSGMQSPIGLRLGQLQTDDEYANKGKMSTGRRRDRAHFAYFSGFKGLSSSRPFLTYE